MLLNFSISTNVRLNLHTWTPTSLSTNIGLSETGLDSLKKISYLSLVELKKKVITKRDPTKDVQLDSCAKISHWLVDEYFALVDKRSVFLQKKKC